MEHVKAKDKEAEKSFHNNYKQCHENRKWIESIKPNLILWAINYGLNLCGNIQGKKVLDFGCGVGYSSEFFLKSPLQTLTGVDLSAQRIKQCHNSLDSKKASFIVSDCEQTCLKNNSFDIIFGNAILHHLDLKTSILEIKRLLKINGRAIFIEPLGHNPLINIIRRLTPKARTKDERPLKASDFNVIKHYFPGSLKINPLFFSIIPLILIFKFLSEKSQKRLVNITNELDKILFVLFPWLKKFAWVGIIELSKKSNS